jgi:hypothetical protein
MPNLIKLYHRGNPLHKIKGQWICPETNHSHFSFHSRPLENPSFTPTIIRPSTVALVWKADDADTPRLAWHPLLPSSPLGQAPRALQHPISLQQYYMMLTTTSSTSQTSTTSNNNLLYTLYPVASMPFKCLQMPCSICPMSHQVGHLCHCRSDGQGPQPHQHYLQG